MLKRTGKCLLVALVVAMPCVAQTGDVFFGRDPFRVRIPWGSPVSYLSCDQSEEALRFIVFATSADREVFGAMVEGYNFADAFESQDDHEILRSLFALKRSEHIEDTIADYEVISSREAEIGGCYAILEEFTEETETGLRMRGYLAVFGDRRVCYWLQISSGESDFPYARARFDRIFDAISVEDAYPAFVAGLPSSVELLDEAIPLVLTNVSDDPPYASVGWDGTGLSLRVTAHAVETAAEAGRLVASLAEETRQAVDESADWSWSSREVCDALVEVHASESTREDGDWTQVVFSWVTGSIAFVADYQRFRFEYDDRDVKQIVRAFLDDG